MMRMKTGAALIFAAVFTVGAPAVSEAMCGPHHGGGHGGYRMRGATYPVASYSSGYRYTSSYGYNPCARPCYRPCAVRCYTPCQPVRCRPCW